MRRFCSLEYGQQPSFEVLPVVVARDNPTGGHHKVAPPFLPREKLDHAAVPVVAPSQQERTPPPCRTVWLDIGRYGRDSGLGIFEPLDRRFGCVEGRIAQR